MGENIISGSLGCRESKSQPLGPAFNYIPPLAGFYGPNIAAKIQPFSFYPALIFIFT
jgi:hypothetical protein